MTSVRNLRRYRRRPEIIRAAQFFPDVQPWPSGVTEGECYCAGLAQDGRRCEIHVHGGKPYYVAIFTHGRVKPGSYLTYDRHGLVERLWTREEFEALYEPDDA